MELKLIRKTFTPESTIGELYVDGKFECFILEDTVREHGVKVPGETAIPYGKYTVIITFSPKFNRYLPLLLNVPNFSGIRIHSGNTSKDTLGCLITGSAESQDMVVRSRDAFNKLYPKLSYASQEGILISLTIEKAP